MATTIDRYTLDDLMLSIDVEVPFDEDGYYDGGDYGGSYLMLDYSGRGMYGGRCIGIVCDNPASVAVDLGLTIGLRDGGVPEDVVEAFRRPRVDSMGRRQIIYWPSLAVASYADEVAATL